MIFNSAEFLIFYPLVLLLYFILPKRCKWPLLLAASYFFYMIWNPPLIFLILFTTAVSYVSAILIEKTESRRKKRLWLCITLITSLGVLFFFKYFNFLAGSVISMWNLFGGSAEEFSLNLILPVGISFSKRFPMSSTYIGEVLRRSGISAGTRCLSPSSRSLSRDRLSVRKI